MFDIKIFSNILQKITNTYSSISEFADKSEVNRTYLSKYINMKLDNPPTPKILEKISISSNGITTYEELMQICGYYEETIENTVYEIYKQLKSLSQLIYKKQNQDLYEVEFSIEKFQEYSSDLLETLEKKEGSKILLIDYFRKDFFWEDYNFIVTFLFLYESFIKCLEKENYLILNNYNFTNWFDLDSFYNKITDTRYLENFEFITYDSKNIIFIREKLEEICQYTKKFISCLNLAYLSDFDNNALTELFKKKASNQQLSEIQKEKIIDPLGLSEIGFDINNYIPPTQTQKEQIKAMVEIILKENKKGISDEKNN